MSLGDNRTIAVADQLPPLQEPVIAVCASFRCRGYVDEDGIWRHGSDGSPIEEPVVSWAEFD